MHPPSSEVGAVDSLEDSAFLAFLEKESLAYELTPLAVQDGAAQEWSTRNQHWPDWQKGTSFIARNKKGEVIGCVKAWQDQSRKLVAEKLPTHLQWLGRALPLLGRPSLRPGQPVVVLQLSYFFVDSTLPSEKRRAVALTLLDRVYSSPLASKAHLINWVPHPGDADLDDLLSRRYLQVTTLGRLFEVVPESQASSLIPQDLASGGGKRYYFDGTL